jgi:chromosome segregation ATPase
MWWRMCSSKSVWEGLSPTSTHFPVPLLEEDRQHESTMAGVQAKKAKRDVEEIMQKKNAYAEKKTELELKITSSHKKVEKETKFLDMTTESLHSAISHLETINRERAEWSKRIAEDVSTPHPYGDDYMKDYENKYEQQKELIRRIQDRTTSHKKTISALKLEASKASDEIKKTEAKIETLDKQVEELKKKIAEFEEADRKHRESGGEAVTSEEKLRIEKALKTRRDELAHKSSLTGEWAMRGKGQTAWLTFSICRDPAKETRFGNVRQYW